MSTRILHAIEQASTMAPARSGYHRCLFIFSAHLLLDVPSDAAHSIELNAGVICCHPITWRCPRRSSVDQRCRPLRTCVSRAFVDTHGPGRCTLRTPGRAVR